MVVVKLVARLTDSSGNPLSGKPIWFYYEMDGAWIHIATAVTGDDGYASIEYSASERTIFKAEFKGDEQYDPASATAVWEPSGGQVAQCQPVVKTGIDVLDSVVFCVGGVGVTVFVLLVALILLIVLIVR